ncbi:MAG: hypothetical protein HY226_05215 [Candidatus Vogelbacteria bacterium]|nr:hypothetical protein [Candidatus Vogelbacteria bacterium]
MIQKQKGSATVWAIVLILLVVLIIWWMGNNHTSTTQTTPVVTPTSPQAVTPTPVMPTYLKTLAMANGSSYLADPSGRTLYTKLSDTKNISTCTGACLYVWPTYSASSVLGSAPTDYKDLGTMKRGDGSMQYTWKGMPLYYYAKDGKIGDTLGNGFNKAWNIARP